MNRMPCLLVIVCFVLLSSPAFAGKYADCVSQGAEKQCKDCCDAKYAKERGLCHDACYEKYPQGQGRGGPRPQPGQTGRPPKADGPGGPGGGPQTFDMAQTLSFGAQTNTIAFDGLAFITGSLCADSFIPPGKVCDYFGFQYLRDNDPTEKGHNTDFLTTVSHNVLATLDRNQRNKLIALAKEQAPQIEQYARMRFPILKAFRRNIEGDLPSGTSRLSMQTVQTQSAKLYRLDGEMSVRRAEVLGGIIRSMDAKQRAYFDSLKGKGIAKWPSKRSPINKRNYKHDIDVAIMTFASQLYSWYAGGIEADTYFCPERHGTYFGSFYMKDIPAMGKRDYTINENLTGDRGKDFLEVLTASQAQKIRALVDRQRDALNSIVAVREEISRMLRMYLVTDTVDDAVILRLAEQYGRYDGELIYLYATTFAEVAKTLTSAQMKELDRLRGLKGYSCAGMFVYSDKIRMPKIGDTDKYFE